VKPETAQAKSETIEPSDATNNNEAKIEAATGN
jgi:hypothetical protein